MQNLAPKNISNTFKYVTKLTATR